jgi:hypothetical protein
MSLISYYVLTVATYQRRYTNEMLHSISVTTITGCLLAADSDTTLIPLHW